MEDPFRKVCDLIAHKVWFAFTLLEGYTRDSKRSLEQTKAAIEYSIMTSKPLESALVEPASHPLLPSASTVLWTTLLLLALSTSLWVAPRQRATIRKQNIRQDSGAAFMSRHRRHRQRWVRPYGMVPQAFKDYVRACARARVNPHRISQTIGNDPRSAGYHQRDGVVVQNRRKIAYCAAVDVDIGGLRAGQIRRLCVSLAREGFAAFYRRGDAWEGDEHIHAVYGAVKMKPQLQQQVRQFLRERRENGFRRLWWVRKFRRRNGS